MLALTRKVGQSVIINDNIEITIVEIKGEQVRLGINAPREVKILRKEIVLDIQSENKIAAEVPKGTLEELNKIIKFTNKRKKPN